MTPDSYKGGFYYFSARPNQFFLTGLLYFVVRKSDITFPVCDPCSMSPFVMIFRNQGPICVMMSLMDAPLTGRQVHPTAI